MNDREIIERIKKTVRSKAPGTKVILYGSRARGDNRPDSDIDILILLDKKKITREDEKRVKYPLYDIEFETGIIVSALVLTKLDWESKHKITPFHDNVSREGVEL
ncbi:MAG: nucleotidyltransferase domain-containing protein [Bacteroidota bacterium]